MEESLIPPHGGYRRLRSYQVAEVVYDATVRFCARFVDVRSRTTDQMIQAAREVRSLGHRSDPSDQTDRSSYALYRPHVEAGTAEVAANTVLCLIHQANYLLDQQLRALDAQFLSEGGFTERLYRKRAAARRSVRSD